jgi:hypothetical protein
MKKPENKTLPFPPPNEHSSHSIVCQIGSERFAIHIEIEDLPPLVAPLLVMKPSFQKGATQQRLIFETHSTSLRCSPEVTR